MPGDSGAVRTAADSGPIPASTDPRADSPTINSEGSGAGGAGSMGAPAPGASSFGTRAPVPTGNLDTILGHMVIDQGLATKEEVDDCLRSRGADPEKKPLSRLLVEKNIVTEKQLARVKGQAEAERTSQHIPGYTILGKLGAGAMAAVLKARQISLDRVVAIKVLPRKFSNNRQFIERFYAEGRAAAQLNHPNIVQAFDVGQSGEFHYFVMEYVEGKTVHDHINDSKRYNEAEALDIIINVADALRHAHEKGLVHRDVKPKNIILTLSGTAKLADLGLARAIDDKEAAAAEKGRAYGTPYYISPEQIRGELNIGPQADIYSLGATLYHMVTGNVPFNGKNPTEVMQKHLKEPLVAPDHVNAKLSAGISEVIEMMMAKSRRQRYKNCTDLLIDLRAVRKGEPPPIAHKEASLHALSQVAMAESAAPTTIAEDRSRPPSPWSHPSVRKLLTYSIVVTILMLALATVAIIAFATRPTG